MLRLSQMLSASYLLLVLLITGLTLWFGPLGWAPLQIPTIGPGGTPVVVRVAYSSEKDRWLQAAVQRYAATKPRLGGHPIQVELVANATVEMFETAKPTVYWPASRLQIEQARRQRMAYFILTPQPMLLSPLVLLTWNDPDRTNLLNEVLLSDDFWNQIQPLLDDGTLRLGITDPLRNDSGQQVLVLRAVGCTEDVQTCFTSLAASISNPSSNPSQLLTNMLLLSQYNVIATPEHLAIEALNTQTTDKDGNQLQVLYLPETILSDHPYAILSAPWITRDQQRAAEQVREFLYAPEIQQLAAQEYGFRPANLQARINPNDVASPFYRYAAQGLNLNLLPQVETPTGETIQSLIAAWRNAE
ncbi:substrate-binding domain-containing protein [Candidatus Oscillochloris fontis]|uniref:substrate-binding domain-containing protein n=1 Tax=Candidatus Oscillochloris fontis TaxID=2496868 RepID=UPI00101C3078|nr:substrate-binding domain-containing protein [Candidatus Oscillochloris fontis]